MDFGRGIGRDSGPDQADFSLPSDARRTASLLKEKSEPPARVRLGAPVWAHAGFVGKIIPEGTPRNRFLREYSRSFDAIELNATFYGANRRNCATWAGLVPDHFRFCPKIPGIISHKKRLVNCRAEVREATQAFAEFGIKLGPVFLLLPETFSTDDLEALLHFVREWPSEFDLAIELRHPSWFQPEALERISPALVDVLTEHRAQLVITDVASRRDVLHQTLLSHTAFVRWSGHALHPSDFERLDQWSERLRGWSDGLREIYFFLHQQDEALVVEAATHLAQALGTVGIETREPHLVTSTPPAQGSLFS